MKSLKDARKLTETCNSTQSGALSEVISHCNRFFQNIFYIDLQWTIRLPGQALTWALTAQI